MTNQKTIDDLSKRLATAVNNNGVLVGQLAALKGSGTPAPDLVLTGLNDATTALEATNEALATVISQAPTT